ncbi:hypothetical protein [Humibacter antri]
MLARNRLLLVDISSYRDAPNGIDGSRKGTAMNDNEHSQRPNPDDLPDGSNSDGSEAEPGEDTASGGGADENETARH